MPDVSIDDKRKLLLSARLKSLPKLGPVRDQAIDQIVLQNSLLVEATPITAAKLVTSGGLTVLEGIPAVTRKDAEISMARLAGEGALKRVTDGYVLPETTRKRLWSEQEEAERRLDRAVELLFRHAPRPARAYKAPFLDALCFIFARLSNLYVGLVQGTMSTREFSKQPQVASAVRSVRKRHRGVDARSLNIALLDFITQSDPLFDEIKWNLAQNYFIARLLGLDESGELLSREMFSGATFYVDTNVVIPGLESSSKHHESFRSFCKACNDLNISVNVLHISLAELQRVVAHHKQALQLAGDIVPPETAKRVRGIFYEVYAQAKRTSPEITVDELFEHYSEPVENLAKLVGIEEIDDPWFVDKRQAKLIRPYADELHRLCDELHRPRKKPRAVEHDAYLLAWIQKERVEIGRSTWVVTLDAVLPLVRQPNQPANNPLALNLDVFLQWIAPSLVSAGTTIDFAAVFSEAIKYRLLPEQRVFDISDFIVFAELGIACEELPAEDVERCIRLIRQRAPHLDPTVPADREKLDREISRFFADPTRRVNRRVSELESTKVDLESRIGELESEIEIERNRGDLVSKELETLRAESSASNRFLTVLVGWLLLVGIGMAAGSAAVGIDQLLSRYWGLLSASAFGLLLVMSWLFVGRRRLALLAPPIKKLMKVDNS